MENEVNPNPVAPPRSRSTMNGCLIVGGIGCMVAVLLGIIGAVVVWMNFRAISGEAGRAVVIAMVDKMREQGLSSEQRDAIVGHVNRLTEDYKANRLDLEQLTELFADIKPHLDVAVSAGIVAGALESSKLGAEEKAAATKSLQRFAHGCAKESISRETIELIVAKIRVPGTAPHEMQFKEKLTDEELRTLVAEAKTAADVVEIPADLPTQDLVAEIGRAIERTLARIESKPAPAGSTPPVEQK
ncbi:MAG: hypothetical protein ACKVX7_19790 [Planctomycetota bacterium]